MYTVAQQSRMKNGMRHQKSQRLRVFQTRIIVTVLMPT